jgi:hypothetical protein
VWGDIEEVGVVGGDERKKGASGDAPLASTHPRASSQLHMPLSCVPRHAGVVCVETSKAGGGKCTRASRTSTRASRTMEATAHARRGLVVYASI